MRWTPNVDSTVNISYGERDGIDSLFVDGSYAPTARTRIYVSYSSGLSSGALAQQSLLQSANFGPGGLQTSSLTGAPLTTTGNAFGIQNGLYRTHLFSLTAVLLQPRDTYTIGVVNQTETAVTGFGATSSTGTYGGTYGQVSWQHDLSPTVSTNVYLQYGTDSTQISGQPGAGSNFSEQFVLADAAVNYALSPSVTTYANYSLASRIGSAVPGRNYLENIALVGLRKAF